MDSFQVYKREGRMRKVVHRAEECVMYLLKSIERLILDVIIETLKLNSINTNNTHTQNLH